jgi:hypothetical protein
MLNQNTHTYTLYIENLVKYVVSVNDYNISLFRIVSNVKLCNNIVLLRDVFHIGLVIGSRPAVLA